MIEMIVTVDDIRASRQCMKGFRKWAPFYGYDWNSFVKNGLPYSELENVDNALVKRVLEQTRKRYGVE